MFICLDWVCRIAVRHGVGWRTNLKAPLAGLNVLSSLKITFFQSGSSLALFYLLFHSFRDRWFIPTRHVGISRSFWRRCSMALIDPSLRSSGCLFVSVAAVIVRSDITLGLSIVSVFGKVFLGAPEPCFLFYVSGCSCGSSLSGYKLSVLIPLYLQICTLQTFAVPTTWNNVFFFVCVISVCFDPLSGWTGITSYQTWHTFEEILIRGYMFNHSSIIDNRPLT